MGNTETKKPKQTYLKYGPEAYKFGLFPATIEKLVHLRNEELWNAMIISDTHLAEEVALGFT